MYLSVSLSVFRRLLLQLRVLNLDNLPEVTEAIKPVLGEYYNYDSTVSDIVGRIELSI